jgi:hypothetical protein
MLAIFNLFTNIITTTFTCLGIATFINRLGNLLKIIEENKNDGFKKGFDTIVLESINDINKCVESISLIALKTNKMLFIIYDITIGKKIIKKDKEGKIIICNKSKLYSGFKEKINELTNKVKKYKNELNKFKKVDDSSLSKEEVNDEEIYSDISEIEEDDEDNKDNEDNEDDKEEKDIDKEKEFYL